MFRWLFPPVFLLLVAVVPCAGHQSPAPGAALADGSAAQSSKSAATGAPGSSAATPTPKKVWTNENLREANGNVSVVGDKRNQKYSMTPEPTADAATVTKIRQNLQKLQSQLDDVNKQLATFKQFQEGEAVSRGAREYDKGYSRTPVDQQMAKLQDKKKQLQEQIDTLLDEARKKGIEPGKLRQTDDGIKEKMP